MRLRLITLGLSVIFGLMLQSTVFAKLNLFGKGLMPDLVLIIVISFALLRGPWQGAVLGLTAGLVADLRVGGVIGVGALAKMITGFIIGLLEKNIFKDNLLVPFLALFAATIVHDGVFLGVESALGRHYGAFFYLVPRILLIALYNAMLAPLVYHQYYRLEKHLAQE